jgi:hypothetical protein
VKINAIERDTLPIFEVYIEIQTKFSPDVSNKWKHHQSKIPHFQF